jgi:putative SOS response-associated peptidase YedK
MMCSRFTSLLSTELLSTIRELFGIQVPVSAESRYNIAPAQQVWVVRNEGGHNRLDLLKWGLVPSEAKDPAIGNQLITAHCETVHEERAFKQAIKYRRCIVPASGIYAWSQSEEKRQPYYIRMADGSPMCFAGLWEQWKTPGAGDEEFLETFTILTMGANKLVAPIHDRMPVILQPGSCNLWLSHDMHDPEQLRGLYLPFPTDLLEAYMVPDLVNNVRFDGPACIARV